MRWTRYLAQMRKLRNEYKILVGKPEMERVIGGT
jgi:hypothetical protein